jgi:hypothetical protein
MNSYWLRRWVYKTGWVDVYKTAENITVILQEELSRQRQSYDRERLIFIIKVN